MPASSSALCLGWDLPGWNHVWDTVTADVRHARDHVVQGGRGRCGPLPVLKGNGTTFHDRDAHHHGSMSSVWRSSIPVRHDRRVILVTDAHTEMGLAMVRQLYATEPSARAMLIPPLWNEYGSALLVPLIAFDWAVPTAAVVA